MLHEMFWQQVAIHPDRVAAVSSESHVTYRELAARACGWTARLRASGVRPESLVGVHLARSVDLVAVLLGVCGAGAAYLPLDPSYPQDRLQFMVEDAELQALVTADAAFAERAGARVAVLAPEVVVGPAPACAGGAPVRRGHGEQLAYVLYTSGSTGAPKGVAITHANAVDLLEWAADMFGRDLDRVLATTSISFDCSILEIFGPLCHGGVAVIGAGPLDIAEGVHSTGVRLLHTVPSVVAELLRTDRLPPSVVTVIVGGEALLPALVERVYTGSRIERLVNLYGPTEYTSYATGWVVPREPTGDGVAPPIGRAVANTVIHLLDGDGWTVIDARGEIAIAGAGLSRGYLGRPGLTAERFVPDPQSKVPGQRMYRTGDLGWRNPGGVLHYLGRIDQQLKHRGVRIEPGEVEHALLAQPGVAEAVVVQADVSGRSVLAAFVVPDFPDAVIPAALRDRLRRTLPSPLVPEVITVLDRMPRAPNGKLDRRALPAVSVPLPAPACSAAASTGTSWTELVADLWARALGVPAVDPSVDVLDLGGHSLAALRVRGGLTALLGVEPPARLMFELSSVATLAEELERRYGPPPQTSVLEAQPLLPADGSGGLSPTQKAVLQWTGERPDADDVMLPLVVRVTGPVMLPALGVALRGLMHRHDILRAVLRRLPGGPRLVPGPDTQRADVALVDLRGLPLAVAEATARDLARRAGTAPMSLTDHPPVRMTVIRINERDAVLVVTLHRIAADAWSMELISHEILLGYAAAIAGGPACLAPPGQYADRSAEQLAFLASDDGRTRLDHWVRRLAEPPTLPVTGDEPRTATPRPPVRHYAWLRSDVLQYLDTVARAERATPFMVLAAGYAALLHAWTGQEDLLIGCPTAGRDREGLAEVVGPCADSFVLRCDLAGRPSFRQVVRQVRERALEAFNHADVPFATLVERLGRPAGRHPLYQASIVLQQGTSLLNPAHRAEVFAQPDIGPIGIEQFLDDTPGTAVDVELMLFPRDDEMEVVIDCRPDAVAADRVPLLAEAFAAILSRGGATPDSPLEEAWVGLDIGSRTAR